ncbi:Major facilitator superfamily domain, general substrate transporter [Fusarium oxysporum f. sp. albedinis]|nr:Major facilitator superfamily domain, general substrate transporter [Fusarium oxysporum f. sp. albedinis]
MKSTDSLMRGVSAEVYAIISRSRPGTAIESSFLPISGLAYSPGHCHQDIPSQCLNRLVSQLRDSSIGIHTYAVETEPVDSRSNILGESLAARTGLDTLVKP